MDTHKICCGIDNIYQSMNVYKSLLVYDDEEYTTTYIQDIYNELISKDYPVSFVINEDARMFLLSLKELYSHNQYNDINLILCTSDKCFDSVLHYLNEQGSKFQERVLVIKI